jgi:hypothetical protein
MAMNRREMLGSLMAFAAAPFAGPLVATASVPAMLTVTDRDVVEFAASANGYGSHFERMSLGCYTDDIVLAVTINGRRFVSRLEDAKGGRVRMLDMKTNQWQMIELWSDNA